jgi:hypothetical protein
MQLNEVSQARLVTITRATKVEITRFLLTENGVRVVRKKKIVVVRKGSSGELALAGKTHGWQTGTHE